MCNKTMTELGSHVTCQFLVDDSHKRDTHSKHFTQDEQISSTFGRDHAQRSMRENKARSRIESKNGPIAFDWMD